MAKTYIYHRGLLIHLEAEELAGANGSNVTSYTDLSGNGRHLIAGTNKPTLATGAINGRRSVTFPGTQDPLQYTGQMTISCGWIVVKPTGDFNAPFAGILTAKTLVGIITGVGGGNVLYDFQHKYFELRINDRIISPTDTWTDGQFHRVLAGNLTANAFNIIFFRFWQPVTVDGIQLGRDRDFSDREFTGSIPFMALYSPERNFCEEVIRRQHQAIAKTYNLGIYDVFPFPGSKGDSADRGKRILAGNQDEPVMVVKREKWDEFEVSFSNRTVEEFGQAMTFWDAFTPEKRFLWRSYETIPPNDAVCRFDPEDRPKRRSDNFNRFAYSIRLIQSEALPDKTIPGMLPSIPDETSPTITLAAFEPSPEGMVGDVSIFAEASDDIGVAYVIFYCNGIDISGVVTSIDENFEFVFDTTTIANGIHSVTAKAYDAAGNVGISNAVTLETDNDFEAPTISFEPLEMQPDGYWGELDLLVTAADNVGIAYVDYYVDGVLTESISVAPFTFPWDTTTVANGERNVTAVAFDEAGNESDPAAIIVDVQNYVLNDMTSTIHQAHSLNKLIASYSGSAIRVKRTSDNTETDIGFLADGTFDAAAAIAFGATLKVVKWYDQSGNNRFMTGFAGAEPTLVTADNSIRFAGSHYFTMPSLAALTAGEFAVKYKLDADPPSGLEGSVCGLGVSNNSTSLPYLNGLVYDDFGSTVRKNGITKAVSVNTYRVYQAYSAASDWACYLSGTQLHTTASNTVGFPAAPRLGRYADFDGSAFMTGNVTAMVIFSQKASGGDRTKLAGGLV